MIGAAWGRVPNQVKVDGILWPLLIVGWIAAFAAGTLMHARTFTVTRTHDLSVQEQYGAPAQSIPGANVNRALAGFVCDVYQSPQTVICHR